MVLHLPSMEIPEIAQNDPEIIEKGRTTISYDS
jgi:hypothetical protein